MDLLPPDLAPAGVLAGVFAAAHAGVSPDPQRLATPQRPIERMPRPARAAASVQAHPLLWRAHQLGGGGLPAVSTGFAALDAQLPGGGWPHRVLTELLLPHPGVGEMRLLAPALAAISTGEADGVGARAAAMSPRHRSARDPAQGRCVMLFDPPAALAAWVLGQLGVDLQQMLVVHGREGARGAVVLRRLLPSADLLWAMEQALRSGHVGAVLAWPPDRLRADAVRRLQLAAAQHDGPVFLFRDIRSRLEASPAPLRLALHAQGPGRLSVHLLKRRGPPLPQSLSIELPPVVPPAMSPIRPVPESRHAPVVSAQPALGGAGSARSA